MGNCLHLIIRHKGNTDSRGFMVFITVPGVVTHKVPFIATPDFNGEYNFNIHGLHYIDASEEFRRWNKEKQVKTLIQTG
jgi:hypothetical protein